MKLLANIVYFSNGLMLLSVYCKVLEAFWRGVLLCNMLGARNSFAARQTMLLRLNTVLAVPAANVRQI